jgi:hypothetical protein
MGTIYTNRRLSPLSYDFSIIDLLHDANIGGIRTAIKIPRIYTHLSSHIKRSNDVTSNSVSYCKNGAKLIDIKFPLIVFSN